MEPQAFVRISVNENNNIHMQVVRGENIVFLYTEEGSHILYIGPFAGKYLYANEEYKTIVSSVAYRHFIGTFIHGTLVSCCTLVNDHFTLEPVGPDIFSKCTFDDSWEWFEIANDAGIRGKRMIDLYSYFAQKPHSIQSLQYCVNADVVRAMLQSLDSHFSGITAPNKNIMSSLLITRKLESVAVLP
jgi:hypothetical protein